MERRRRRGSLDVQETSFWQSYSDMMAGVLLMFILIICGTLFVLMQVKNSYDESELALRQRETELEQTAQENQEYVDLTRTQNERLLSQQEQLAEQQAKLDDQQAQLDEQKSQLDAQREVLDQQQTALQTAQTTLEQREAELQASQTLLASQQQTLDQQQTALETQQAQLEQIIGVKRDLIAALSDAFSSSDLRISIDEQTGAIRMDSSVLFDYDSADLTEEGERTLDALLPAYFDVVLSDEYVDYISEIIIEGHTDTAGTYTYNLSLSQARAEAVAAYCLDDGEALFPADTLERVRTIVSASGRSWSDPVYGPDGQVDAEASRRVEIKFRLSDEQMIDQMLDVLQQYE